MKLLICLVVLSTNLFASQCESLRPNEFFFSVEYMVENFGAPNFDDTCFEDYSREDVKECYEEVEQYEKWLGCLKLR